MLMSLGYLICEDMWSVVNSELTLSSDAVVHESLRIHGNTGMMLERVVPIEGMSIDGYFLPAGTIVGCNSWVMHRNKDVFGQDVEDFRPERWLIKDTRHVAEMKRALFSVGTQVPAALLHIRLTPRIIVRSRFENMYRSERGVATNAQTHR